MINPIRVLVDPDLFRAENAEFLDKLPAEVQPPNAPHGKTHYTVDLAVLGAPYKVKLQVTLGKNSFRVNKPLMAYGTAVFQWSDHGGPEGAIAAIRKATKDRINELANGVGAPSHLKPKVA